MTTPAPSAPPANPYRTRSAFAVRAAISAVLFTAFYFGYPLLVDLVVDRLERLLGTTVEPVYPRMFLVTALCAVLVGVWWKLIGNDQTWYAPLLITYILAMGDVAFGILENHPSPWLEGLTGGMIASYNPTFLAMLATVVADLLLARFYYGKWPHLASAYISGISVGILIKSPELWPFIMCGLLSITSKYVLRFRGRHLWNPSNFGVTMMMWLAATYAGTYTVQTGNEIWSAPLLIWVLGGIILYRLKRLHLPVLFVAIFIPLGFFRSAVTGERWQTELGPVTWPMFQLFIFFMITDPKTTTKARWSQCLVVVLVAMMDTFLRLCFEETHSLYWSLFIVGPISNLVEILYTTKPAPAVKPAPAEQPAPTQQPVPAKGDGSATPPAPVPMPIQQQAGVER